MDQASLKATLAKTLQSDSYSDDRKAITSIGLTVEMLQDPDSDLEAFFYNLLLKDDRTGVENRGGAGFCSASSEFEAGYSRVEAAL
jgi:hypothetical protein